MYRGHIGMADAGCCSGFPQETAPGRFVPDELCANDLESHRAPEVGVNGFVGYSHTAMPELKRFSVLVSENLVVLEAELGRGIRNRIALGFDGASQGANWAVIAVVR